MDWINIVLPLAILGVLGAFFGCLLGFASKKFEVKGNPLADQLREALPGANCGGCGFVGCDEYAQALAEGRAKPGLCAVGGDSAYQEICRALGQEPGSVERMVAHVKCLGTCDNAVRRVDYYGAADCEQLLLLPGGGDKSCAYGCLGMGTCMKACKFDAISIENGVAKIDETKCMGCGACTEICPKHVIELIPADSLVRMSCQNPAKGKEVMSVCKAGCIGCGLCAKNCPQLVIEMENNLPKFNYELCIGCGICAEKCPKHCITAR